MRSPTELQRILDEVIKLPKRKQKELAQLLDRNGPLGNHQRRYVVADRLKFLQASEIILFDYESKDRLRNAHKPQGR